MPRLWETTIEEHRREVRNAIEQTTAALAAQRGLPAVTMSAIAAETGIGRATLYKYFPNVEAILLAWHERQLAGHLDHLITLREEATDPHDALAAVLDAYALIQHEHRGGELMTLLHRGRHVAQTERRLQRLLRELLADGAATGVFRSDVAADELAVYCLHALQAAGQLPSKAAAQRLADVVLDGLRPRC